LNPAIDKRLSLELFERGSVNRVINARPEPGGKSVHVAMVLRTLGADPLWIGFTGGPSGRALEEGIRKMGIRARAIEIENPTRTNLEILENDGTVTEILEPGPALAEGDLERLQRAYELALQAVGRNGTAVLSGSLPRNAPDDYYSTLIRIGHENGCRVFLDTSGKPLQQAMNANPDLVKPNQHEAEWISESVIPDHYAAQIALQKILRSGAKAAAISLGGAGIVYQSSQDGTAIVAMVPSLVMRSSTGSGDAAMAGFAYAADHELRAPEALRLAAACGTANCLADGPGKARIADIERLKGEIQIRDL
jgi:1-phosphofructokinase family hexose kinase